jgi:hypothetical protein
VPAAQVVLDVPRRAACIMQLRLKGSSEHVHAIHHVESVPDAGPDAKLFAFVRQLSLVTGRAGRPDPFSLPFWIYDDCVGETDRQAVRVDPPIPGSRNQVIAFAVRVGPKQFRVASNLEVQKNVIWNGCRTLGEMIPPFPIRR